MCVFVIQPIFSLAQKKINQTRSASFFSAELGWPPWAPVRNDHMPTKRNNNQVIFSFTGSYYFDQQVCSWNGHIVSHHGRHCFLFHALECVAATDVTSVVVGLIRFVCSASQSVALLKTLICAKFSLVEGLFECAAGALTMHLSGETSRTIVTRKATLIFRKNIQLFHWLWLVYWMKTVSHAKLSLCFHCLANVLSFSQDFLVVLLMGYFAVYAVVALCMILK